MKELYQDLRLQGSPQSRIAAFWLFCPCVASFHLVSRLGCMVGEYGRSDGMSSLRLGYTSPWTALCLSVC